MSKLTKKEQKETEILAKRIMPKTDFQKIIEHDKTYYNILNQALEYNVVKQDIMSVKYKKIIKKQSKDEITKNIDLLVDFAETSLKILDFQAKLRIQQKLVDDKEMHFENVFLPQFEKESKEAKENFLKVINRAKVIVDENNNYFESLINKINYEFAWWDKVDEKSKKNEEYVIQLYKPLKRILANYDKKIEELKTDKKYN
jgi:hypothetical protein|tara:strand:+ start:3204 stop:3806 length:603 start_codon:yes stop_codon:yes gene_type:complete